MPTECIKTDDCNQILDGKKKWNAGFVLPAINKTVFRPTIHFGSQMIRSVFRAGTNVIYNFDQSIK